MLKLFKRRNRHTSVHCSQPMPGELAGETILTLLESVNLTRDPDDPGTVWAKLPDGLRLIFRGGKYVGSYDPNLPEVLS